MIDKVFGTNKKNKQTKSDSVTKYSFKHCSAVFKNFAIFKWKELC